VAMSGCVHMAGGLLCWRSEPETLAVGKLERLKELFVDRLSARRNDAAAKPFFGKAIRGQQRPPHTITMDGYAASHSAVHELKADGCLPTETKLRSSTYLNNLIEQNHRSVKQRVAVMPGFNQSNAAITIVGIEPMHRIRKGQFDLPRLGVQGGAAPATRNAILGM
jgi:transposase-like protein